MKIIKKNRGSNIKINKFFMGGMPQGAPQGAPPPGMGGPPGAGGPGGGGMPPGMMEALTGGGQKPEGPVEKKEGGEINLLKFKKALNFVENSGEMDYSVTNKSGTSAIGPYQIMYSVHKDPLKKMFGIESAEEFIGNEEVQEGYMDFLINEEYPRMVDAIKKYYGPGGTKLEKNAAKDFSKEGVLGDLTDTDLMALEHFLGHRGLMNYLAHIREGKKGEFKPEGKNLSVDEYLKRFKSSYLSKKERPEATEEMDPQGSLPPQGQPQGGLPGFMGGGPEMPPGLSV